MSESLTDTLELSHHKQLELCTTRPLYRQGRKLTAVKVFTVNNESEHLLIFGVPSINLRSELKALCLKYGKTKSVHLQTQYKTEQFTECYHVHYERIQSARIAKRFLDNKSFYGGVLHVCYAPEYESINETRHKLEQRRKDVWKRISNDDSNSTNLKETTTPQILDTSISFKQNQHKHVKRQIHRKKRTPAIPIDDNRLGNQSTSEIWNGIPPEIDPRINNGEISSKKLKYEIKKHYVLPGTQSRETNKNPVKPISSASINTFSFVPNSVIKNKKLIENKVKRIVFCDTSDNKNG